MKEVFKEIPGFTNYQVSNFGRVVSSRNGEWKALKQWNHRHGYFCVNLHKEGKMFHKFIHRLVAEAFIPNDGNLPQVNHKDGDKKNNNLLNLEWCTSKQNTNHAVKNGLFIAGEKNGRSKLKESDIPVIMEFCKSGLSDGAVAAKYGVSAECIRLVRIGKNWKKAKK